MAAGQQYTTVAGRLENFAGKVLARAQFTEQLSKLGDMHEMPENKGQKITFLRYLPYGGVDNQFIAAGGDTSFISQHLVAEGVTPPANSIGYTTFYTTLRQIGCLFSYTDVTFDLHEEGKNFPPEMETQVSERLVLCREFMVYGAMKGCTNAYFGGVGTTIDTVNGPPTRDMAQKVERAVKGKFGFTLNKMLGAGTGISQHPIPASFPAYVHTDMRRTLENIVGFTKVENYGGRPLLDEDNEIGSLGSLRFIENPIQTYIPNGGAAVGTWTGVGTAKSTGGSLMDVYPIIVMGRGKAQGGAFGQVALRGKTAIKVTHVPLGQTDKSDPLGQRGYIGGITYQAQLIENDAWMAVLYVGCQD